MAHSDNDSSRPRGDASHVIDPRDESLIVAALEREPATKDIGALRTRALYYLLRDGALRTKAAVWLDADEVVKDPRARRIQVVQEATMRACEGNNHRQRTFLLTQRSRDAIADYLQVVREGGWLANANRLEGPLWISTYHHGSQQRLSQRMAMQAWRTFRSHLKLSCDCQLDDVVLTGRVAFLKATRGATGSIETLAQHAGVSAKWAFHYQEHLPRNGPSRSVRAVLGMLDQEQKHKRR